MSAVVPGKCLSERILDLLRPMTEAVSMQEIREHFSDPEEKAKLPRALHKMATGGLLSAERRDARSNYYRYAREPLRVYNPTGLTKAERRKLTAQRYAQKAGKKTREEYLAESPERAKLRGERKATAKRVKRAEHPVQVKPAGKRKVAQPKLEFAQQKPVAAEVRRAESVEEWMLRTGKTPEQLPGLKSASPCGRKPALGILGVH